MANDGWETPLPLFKALDDEFGFELDAASSDENALCVQHLTATDDALKVAWHKLAVVVWLNPPYSKPNLQLFLRKALEESRCGCTVVVLVPADTSTQWWHDYAMKAAEVRFLKTRIRHWFGGKPTKGQPGPKFGSAVLVFSEQQRLARFTAMEVPR